MKTCILLVILLISKPSLCFSSEQYNKQALISFCKLWGFLKYHHPAVATGEMDWDKVFLTQLEIIKDKDSVALDRHYSKWIEDLNNKVYPTTKVSYTINDEIRAKKILSDLLNPSIFSDSLRTNLLAIATNRGLRHNKYIDFAKGTGIPIFTNEKSYEDSLAPSLPMRLLALARYWNLIEYYFPYKDLTDNPWNNVLENHLTSFIEANDTLSYFHALASLISEVNDVHSSVITQQNGFAPYGNLQFQYSFKIIDDKVVVSNEYFNNDSLAKIDGVKVGDVILKIDGIRVADLSNLDKPRVSASNVASLNRILANNLSKGNKSTAEVEILRSDTLQSLLVHRYSINYLLSLYTVEPESWCLLNKDVAYISMACKDVSTLKEAIKSIKSAPNLIFDLRKSGGKLTLEDLASAFSCDRKKIWNYVTPNQNVPGLFDNSSFAYFGKKQKAKYAGRVIVLTNEYVQSFGESICLLFKTFDNVVFIGTQTAGTDGDVTKIYLPGGYMVRMTGAKMTYPNGQQFQRIGLLPDIAVQPTVEGIKNNKDEILEYAIEYARSGE